MNARCFLCAARITPSDLLVERVEGQQVIRRYQCSFCSSQHEVSGFVGHAASTSVRQPELVISRRQAADELVDLAQVIANVDGLPVPMAYLADLSQLAAEWADGTLPDAYAQEFQRLRTIR